MKIVMSIAVLLSASLVFAEAKVGTAAPTFSEADQTGKTISLADLKGKWVVLEWYNEDCPYVKKHYESKNMQKLQKTYTDKKVTWLTVASSAKGKQGYVDSAQAKEKILKHNIGATAMLLDADGSMGKAYGAKTTPHMFVINPEGLIAYAGAIDDNDSANPKVIPTSKNYVAAALDAALAGKAIETAASKPYGCSVKYQ